MINDNNRTKKRIDFPYPPLTRRQFMTKGAAATAVLLLAACGQEDGGGEQTPSASLQNNSNSSPAPWTSGGGAVTLAPTPPCDDEDEETLAQSEGPFYTPNTPQRMSFLEDGPGSRMVLSGRVITTDCRPVSGAVVDFWHADDGGIYDNEGNLFRGHQFTDDDGRYFLETVVPGLYPGRTRHFHIKVQGPETALLTTQLYFPDEEANAADGLFNDALLMEVVDTAGGLDAVFDFVI